MSMFREPRILAYCALGISYDGPRLVRAVCPFLAGPDTTVARLSEAKIRLCVFVVKRVDYSICLFSAQILEQFSDLGCFVIGIVIRVLGRWRVNDMLYLIYYFLFFAWLSAFSSCRRWLI